MYETQENWLDQYLHGKGIQMENKRSILFYNQMGNNGNQNELLWANSLKFILWINHETRKMDMALATIIIYIVNNEKLHFACNSFPPFDVWLYRNKKLQLKHELNEN